jgi:SsrA-binding protein
MAEKVVTFNRKALHDYHILETVEAGLVLTGTEIKSIRDGRVNLREAYARPEDDELWLHNAHIAQYPSAGQSNHEPTRKRKLLLHRSQIEELSQAVEEKGLTLVPLRLYLRSGRAKVELALARGRRMHDKRQAIAKREAERQMERALRHR